MPRKRRHEEDEMMDDDEMKDNVEEDDEDEGDADGDDEDTIDLDSAEEEEEDDDDVDDDEDEDDEESDDDIERKKLFEAQAEEFLENLTMEDVKEVLQENELDVKLAPKLKKLLVEVLGEGDVDSVDDAWDEALERLQE